MDKKYYIYKHTNLINKKVYIGQTCQKPQYRWGKDGHGYKQCPYFYNAILKYGWNNFKHEILQSNLTAEQANKKEQEYISFYKSTQEQFGYNNQAGGSNHTLLNEESKEKHRQKIIERWQDPQFKLQMSKIMKEKWQQPEYRQKHSKPLTEQHRQKIKQISLQTSHWNDKAVICLETNEKFKSSGEAARKYNLNSNNLRSACNGDRRTCGGFHWIFAQDDNEQIRKERLNKPVGNARKVRCKNNGMVFQSSSKAAKWCGLASSGSITAAIRGVKKSAGKDPITKEKLTWEWYKGE